MNIYLAARYSRMDELNLCKQQLEGDGHHVTSRWLEGDHNWTGATMPLSVAERFAREDLEDIEDADAVVCFTEPERTGPTRGGRHVEFGYSLALGKLIYVVGEVENVFYADRRVKRYKTWSGARKAINANEVKWLAGIGFTPDYAARYGHA
jgi:nucleoside 2-deoxyribosyltransferase